MKNIYLIGAIIILLILGLAGGYYYLSTTPKKASSSTAETQEKTIPEAQGGMMSLSDLLALGKNQQCTFSYDGKGTKIEGTTYISGKKVRSDYKTVLDNKTTEGSMIMDGEYLYTWSTLMPQGVKMKVTDDLAKLADDAKKDMAKNPQQFMNPNDKMDYKCQGWAPQATSFTPPTNVTFMDFSKELESVKDLQKGVTDNKCQACASLSGDAAAMCKKSLNCE